MKPTRRLVVVAVAVFLIIAAAGVALQRQAAALGGLIGPHESTTITQQLVVERMKAVAKLVTSETMVRDVVTYENTWYGSTKRSLIVVSGKINAGVNLDRGTSVSVDDQAKTITLTLPKAEVLGIEVTDMRTYDERGGLWNPFTPRDRDAIVRLARAQLGKSAYEMKVLEHAEQSAKTLLEGMFSTDGYTARVEFVPRLETRPAR
ncbi:MAG TPA: DUF4230 domain-containing protein [Gemmatimonadaceae bacterium]|nr:DUF4230 domain-containing protein [Gemmatimonadaceae bacterium]